MAALLAAVTCVLAQITLPLGPVPFTLAVLGVFLMGQLLTPVWALASILVYIFLGLVGVPAFASFSAGPAVLFGTTGGYIFGYIFMAVLPALARANKKLPDWANYVALVLGLVLCYALGTGWFMVLTGNGLVASLGWCVFPFVLPDLVKAACAVVLARALSKRLSVVR
jgi:biotin transport system substrate-specific component